jgi:hypothetical protein
LLLLLWSFSGEERIVVEEYDPPAFSAMLKQEELAFMKDNSTLQLSPALLRELRRAMAVSKKRKALAPSKAKPSGEVVDEVQSSLKPLQLPAGKRKATEFST